MQISNSYVPSAVFAPTGAAPRVFIAPQRYIQGEGALAHLGRYTALPLTNATRLHGEMVAMGTLAQLVLESRADEARRVAQFFAQVGLPVHLGQLRIHAGDPSAIDTIVEGALAFPFIGNMPMQIDAPVLRKGLLGANDLGLAVCAQAGEASYQRLHGGCLQPPE